MDIYDGVESEMSYRTKFDQNSHLGTTYLDNQLKTEERFPIKR